MTEGDVREDNIGAVKGERMVGESWRGGWVGCESVVWIREGVCGGVVCQEADE